MTRPLAVFALLAAGSPALAQNAFEVQARSIPELLLNSGNSWVLVPITAMLIPIIAILVDGIKGSADTREREKTKREIAAYVAEGSISPDEAERLLNANDPKRRRRQRKDG